MFQLIISILAIILAVALAGVSVYYGGSAFSNGSEKAEYATLTNQAAQVEAAMTLFRAETGGVATYTEADLVTAPNSYLKQLPSSDFNVAGGKIIDLTAEDAVCDVDGKSDVVSATAITTAAEAVADTTVLAAMTGVSGCFTADVAATGSPVNVFYYSL